jgi:hypothetical protein
MNQLTVGNDILDEIENSRKENISQLQDRMQNADVVVYFQWQIVMVNKNSVLKDLQENVLFYKIEVRN